MLTEEEEFKNIQEVRIMKNKVFILGWLTLLMVVAVACSNGSDAKNDDEFDLRASTAFNKNHVMFGHAESWMNEVEERTDGKVQFEVFTSEELIEAGKEYDGLNSGLADLGVGMLPGYDPQRFPLTEVTLLPLTETSLDIAMEAYLNLFESDVELQDGKTFYELEWKSEGIKALPAIITPEYLMSSTEDQINSKKNISNLKLRTAARTHDFYAENIGANTISMPATDMYDALSRGALDGSFLSIADWNTYGFNELLESTLQGVSLGHYAGVTGFTQEQWDKFPEDIQEKMEKANKDMIPEEIEKLKQRTKENKESNLEQGGKMVKLNDLDSDVQELLINGLEKTWKDWIDAMEEEGHPGLEIARLWRDLILEAGGDVPEGVKEL